MQRRRFLASLASLGAGLAAKPGAAAAALPVGADADADAPARLDASAALAHYLHRIDAIDRRGPRLNSLIELNPDARAIAATLDAERRAGRLRGPLHGTALVIKDNLATG